jgi:hypothetical protein
VSHAEALRARLREAPVEAPAAPWRKLAVVAVGGLRAVGFGEGFLLVASSQGRGLFDRTTGARVARDPSEDYDDGDLECEGIGALAGSRIRMAGIDGGGLRTASPDGWTVDVVAADWPAERVVLSAPGRLPFGVPDRGGWQVIHDEQFCELRATGFAPDGRTLVIASSCELRIIGR